MKAAVAIVLLLSSSVVHAQDLGRRSHALRTQRPQVLGRHRSPSSAMLAAAGLPPRMPSAWSQAGKTSIAVAPRMREAWRIYSTLSVPICMLLGKWVASNEDCRLVWKMVRDEMSNEMQIYKPIEVVTSALKWYGITLAAGSLIVPTALILFKVPTARGQGPWTFGMLKRLLLELVRHHVPRKIWLKKAWDATRTAAGVISISALHTYGAMRFPNKWLWTLMSIAQCFMAFVVGFIVAA